MGAIGAMGAIGGKQGPWAPVPLSSPRGKLPQPAAHYDARAPQEQRGHGLRVRPPMLPQRLADWVVDCRGGWTCHADEAWEVSGAIERVGNP